MACIKKIARLFCVWQGPPLQHRWIEPVAPVEEEQQSLPPPKEVEAVSFLSFSVWSSSDDDFERYLEDDKDAATETPEDSPRLEWWEEAERKAEEEEEEDEMLREQKALLVSFATARMEEKLRRPRRRLSAQSHLRADLAAYQPARSFPSEDSPRLR
jgi:hypothetical protein